MLRFPPCIAVKALKGFCVCHFKDTRHEASAPAHFWFVVPTHDPDRFILSVITSQVETQTKYYQRHNKRMVASLVPVNKESLSCLTKKSVIDCNQAELLSREEIASRIAAGSDFKTIQVDMPETLKCAVVQAIRKSPRVKPRVKKYLPRTT